MSKMSVVERAARAADPEIWRLFEAGAQVSAVRIAKSFQAARAVIQSLRDSEPSEATQKASALRHTCSCGRRITQWGVNCWPGMLDSILNEEDR